VKDLTEASDEEIAAEVERRDRRRAAAYHDNQIRDFAHAICLESDHILYEPIHAKMLEALGERDYALFLQYPARFVVDLTAAYVGSR